MSAISGKLSALLLLKQQGFISKPVEAKYLGTHGGDHVFGLVSGDIVAVDLILEKVYLNGEDRGY